MKTLTINEAREQANVAYRADRLFADGYTIESGNTLAKPEPRYITSTAGQTYIIDPLTQTCNCPYFTKKNQGKILSPDATRCKHLLGWEKLEKDQLEAEMMEIAFRNGIDWE